MDMIVFTGHAKIQMQERRISEKMALECLNKPLKTVSQKNSRFLAIKKIRRLNKIYLIAVVFDKLNGTKEVVTAFYTSKFSKYL